MKRIINKIKWSIAKWLFEDYKEATKHLMDLKCRYESELTSLRTSMIILQTRIKELEEKK